MQRSRTTLVWGPLGFIGRHLIERLLKSGEKVRVLSRNRDKYDLPHWVNRVEWFELTGDHLLDRSVLQSAVQDVDIVYNLAGASGAAQSNKDPIHSLETNCRIQLEFIEACKTHGKRPRVVFSSSRLIYGETGLTQVSEEYPPAPLSIYAAHKLCVENYLSVFGKSGVIDYTICRISNAYGFDDSTRGQGYKIINLFIQRGLENQPITLFGDGSQLRDLIHIHDLVDALILCGTHPAAANEVFNIGFGQSYPMIEAARMIQSLTGGTEISFRPWPREYLLVESGDFVGDISKARTFLGFSPRFDLEAGLNQTVEDYRRIYDNTWEGVTAHV